MDNRIYNFSAGPAVLPEEVVQIVKDNLLNYQGSGLGVMEMSHRGPEFDEILETTELNFRKLLSISDDYAVLFTTGGATNQFSMVPMNLLSDGTVADYILTGAWSKKAAKEAKKFGEVCIAASSEDKNFSYIPDTFALSDNASYVHYTSNNTIFGTQFSSEPAVGGAPLICDASSDFLHKKIDIDRYGLIYAGAQKNLGPAGVTIVIVRKDLLQRVPDNLPIMMDYRTYADSRSVYNTPPSFPIYVVGEVLKWIDREGGLDAMERRNRDKAGVLYEVIDGTDFFVGTADLESRSLMNLTFRLKNQDLEADFIKASAEQGFSGLKGHRSVGGMRASIYNAFPHQGVVDLATFMKDFERKYG